MYYMYPRPHIHIIQFPLRKSFSIFIFMQRACEDGQFFHKHRSQTLRPTLSLRKLSLDCFWNAFHASNFDDNKNLKGPSIKDVRIFWGHFWPPPPPCRNFDPDLPNFYLLISCNIKISDPPSPLKYSDVFYGWPPTFQKKILWKLDDVRHDKFEMSFQPSLPTLKIVSSQLWILKQRCFTQNRDVVRFSNPGGGQAVMWWA